MGSVNQGVVVSGQGVLNARQLVVGSNARIDSIVESAQPGVDKTIADLRSQLDALLAVVRENRHCLPPEAESALVTVREEVDKLAPNKMVVTSVLGGVSEVVKSFGSLAGAITAVRELVALVL